MYGRRAESIVVTMRRGRVRRPRVYFLLFFSFFLLLFFRHPKAKEQTPTTATAAYGYVYIPSLAKMKRDG